MEKLTIIQKLIKIQEQLRAPKNNINKFGNFNYRSAEDILEAVKIIVHKYWCVIKCTDDVVNIWDINYIKATAEIKDDSWIEFSHGFAKEAINKKWMDDAQITWVTSSYARKYALNWLFAIDDTKDADYSNNKPVENLVAKTKEETEKFEASFKQPDVVSKKKPSVGKCDECWTWINIKVKEFSEKVHWKPLCYDCQQLKKKVVDKKNEVEEEETPWEK